MSDYTPTTEEVRLPPLNAEVIKELALLGLDQMVVDVDDEKAKQFLAHVDRWLAEVKAQAWEEGQLALLEYMGVPLYPSKGDEPRNPKQPRNPYRQGEEQ